MRAVEGIIIGILLGLAAWAAIGLAWIYYGAALQPVEARRHIDAYPDRYTWTCNTDTECEEEEARRRIPLRLPSP